jgi:HlyD family secretion protein
MVMPAIAIAAIGYWWRIPNPTNAANWENQVVWQEVDRSDLEVVVLERGSLESQSNIDLICEVEDVRKDNINGTTILWMIPNGASVNKGDLIVELDSNPMQEALDEQILYTENALAEKIQAEANLKNQLTMNLNCSTSRAR